MTTPRTTALALAGLTLAATLTGCAADAGADAADAADTTGAAGAAGAAADSDATAADESGDAGTGGVADGTYAEVGTYTSPAGEESIAVTLTLEGGVVTAVEVTPQATNPTSKTFQTDFASGVAAQVVGKPVEELDLDVVSGASLTTQGFASAVEAVVADARG